MIFPDNYLKIALLGTRKNVAAGSTGMSDLDALLEKVPGQDTAATWSKLATIYVYSRGKKVLQTKSKNSDQVSFSPLKTKNQEKVQKEGKKPMSPQLLDCLEILRQGKFDSCWQEFLEIVEKENYQFPAQYLPFLLQKTLLYENLRPYTISIAGEKGRWLIGLNPRWQDLEYDLPDLDRKNREKEELEKREKLVCLIGLLTKEPQRTKEFLQEIWPKQKTDEKLKFLEAMEVSLDSQDQVFLEHVLEEKQGDVCLKAFRMLTKLPGSHPGREAADFWQKTLQALKNPNKAKVDLHKIWAVKAEELGALYPYLSKSLRFKYREFPGSNIFACISLDSFPYEKHNLEDFLKNIYYQAFLGPSLLSYVFDQILAQKQTKWIKGAFNRLNEVLIQEYPSKLGAINILPEKDRQECLNWILESVAESYRAYGNFSELEQMFSLFGKTIWPMEAANAAWKMVESKMTSVTNSKRDPYFRNRSMEGIYYLPRILEKLVLVTETSLLLEKAPLVEKFLPELNDVELKNMIIPFNETYKLVQFRLKIQSFSSLSTQTDKR